ncbi:MAG: helicase HerA-like domain-containing protein [Gammaproteobacteria bacterium]
MSQDQILVGGGDRQISLLGRYANRHGLVTGATGTGKTVTLQVLAEGFSAMGVPVFLSDVKGDLSGLSQPAKPHPKITERIDKIGIDDYTAAASPVVFWDIFGQQGHPIRATVIEMGPLLLARLLELNDTQQGILHVAFRVADDDGLLLLDLPDLRSLLNHVAENAAEYSARYGNISRQSVAAIQRRLLVLEDEGAAGFFGEPALELGDLRRTDMTGRGIINVLDSRELINRPRLYATFLLWLLSELFEELPEVGDPDRPTLVFFFDEAHLLFDDAPKALLDKVEQVVRLIRSKGVGVYFVTQNPLDVPGDVLGQLGNRVQHALRAYTPRDRKAVRAAAATFRQNPGLDAELAITQLGVGEALVSTLEEKGVPGIVERCLVCPPRSRIGPASDEERAAVRQRSPVGTRYDQVVDRESAHEILARRAEAAAAAATAAQEKAAEEKGRKAGSGRASSRQSYGEAAAKSVIRSISSTLGRTLGRELLRGILGTISRR